MKEEIEKASQDHIEVDRSDRYQSNYWDGYEEGFEKGAEFVLAKFNGLSPATVSEMVERINNFENELSEAFYRGREIEYFTDKGVPIFKRPTFEGYLREISKADKELKG